MGTAAIFGEACIVALISAGASCLFRRYSRNQFEGYHASDDCAGLQCPCLSRSLHTLAFLGCVSQGGQCRSPFASDTIFLNSGLSVVIELDDTVFWADWIIRGLSSVENTLNVVPSSFLRHLDAPGEIIVNQLS